MTRENDELAAGDPTDVRQGRVVVPAVLFAVIALLIGFDVVGDYRSGTALGHLVAELTVMALSLLGAIVLWRLFREAQRRAATLRLDLAAAREQASRFREDAHDALRGLGEAIDRQFGRWELTPAEREVGLLLLKGLSHREIAQLRSTSDTTVRQQALSLYRKSGLRGRSELAAFFLEDLLLPSTPREASTSR